MAKHGDDSVPRPTPSQLGMVPSVFPSSRTMRRIVGFGASVDNTRPDHGLFLRGEPMEHVPPHSVLGMVALCTVLERLHLRCQCVMTKRVLYE